MMELKVGMRLGSAVCDTEVIVVRAPNEDLDLRCGGRPMLLGSSLAGRLDPVVGFTEGSALGKRYCDADLALELLVTKAGSGSLAVRDRPLQVKEPKRLPTSD